MHKRAFIRRIGLILCIAVEAGWAQHRAGRWLGAVSPDSPTSTSDDLDILPCDYFLVTSP